MAIIGSNAAPGAGGTYGTTSPHRLVHGAAYDLVASSGEQVVTASVRVRANPIADVVVGLYDITDGYSTATLVNSATVTVNTELAVNSSSVGPWTLTSGRTYGVAFRTPNGDCTIEHSYQASVTRNSTLQSTSAFGATWSDSGDAEYIASVWLTTEIASSFNPAWALGSNQIIGVLR